MTTRCAWCEAELPESERDHREDISHGICDAHLAKLRADLQAKREHRVDEAGMTAMERAMFLDHER